MSRQWWRGSLQVVLLMLDDVRSQQISQRQTRSFPGFGQIGFPVDWHCVSLCHAALHYDTRSPDAPSIEAQVRASAEAYCNSVPFEMLVLQSSDDLAMLPLYCAGGQGGMPTVFLDNDDGISLSHECAASARAQCMLALDAAFSQRLANTMLETTWETSNDTEEAWTIKGEVVVSIPPVHLVPRLPLPPPDLAFNLKANYVLWAPEDGDLPREHLRGGIESYGVGEANDRVYANAEAADKRNHSRNSEPELPQPEQRQRKLRVFVWPARWRDAFYRERRLLLAGLRRHPGVELVGARVNDDWWRAFLQEAVFGGVPLPELEELGDDYSGNSSNPTESGAALANRLMRARRCASMERDSQDPGSVAQIIMDKAAELDLTAAGNVEGGLGASSFGSINSNNNRSSSRSRCFVGGNTLLKEWLKADLVIFLVDEGPYYRLDKAQQRYLALIDPRGLVPRSRLVVIDYRDTPTKRPRSTPGLRFAADFADWQASLYAAARTAAKSAWTSTHNTDAATNGALDASMSGAGNETAANARAAADAAAMKAWITPKTSYSTAAQFMLVENCVLYLERAWNLRRNGAFVPPCSIDYIAGNGGRDDDGIERLQASTSTSLVSAHAPSAASRFASAEATRAATDAMRAWAARADPMRCLDPAALQPWPPQWNTTSIDYDYTPQNGCMIAPHRPIDFAVTDEMLPGYDTKNSDKELHKEKERLSDEGLTSALPDVSGLMNAVHSGIPMVSDLKDPIDQAALEHAAAFAKGGGLLIFFLSQLPLRPDSNTAYSCLLSKGINGADPIDVAAAIWHAERPLKLVCMLRPPSGQSHSCRVRALKWAASLCASRGLQGHECFMGQWSDALRDTFDQSYFNILRRAQVVVTQKPCDYEGDYRTWEVLAAGAVLVVDAPARGFGSSSGRLRQRHHSSASGGGATGRSGGSSSGGGGAFSGGADGATAFSNSRRSSSLVHGEHAEFFDATNRESFDRVVRGLLDAPLRRRYLLARNGHRLALEKHRAVSRVDAILNAVVEAWEHWPHSDLTEFS